VPRSSGAISGAPAGSPRTGPRLGILVDLNAAGPAGSACFSVQGSTGCLELLGWSGRSTPTGVCAPSQDVGVGSLDPTGSRMARCCDASHHVLVWRQGATVQATSLSGFPSDWDCWLDAQHLLSGAALDAQPKPALINLATGVTVAVAAKGFCGGVLPGDLSR
jgi:hypothetical protein